MKHSSRIATFLVLVFLTAAAGRPAAGSPQAMGRHASGLQAKWKRSLRAADDALRAAEWEEARKISEGLLRRMLNRIASGEGEAAWLAAGAFYRGLAEAGLGDLRNGRWDFEIALSFDPDLRRVDLAPYGRAGEVAAPWQLPSADDEKAVAAADEPTEEASEGVGEVAAPVRIQSPPPRVPHGKRSACRGNSVEVRMVVDRQGMPQHPTLLTRKEAVYGFAALDVLRDWRFRPAQLDGEAVEVNYSLRVQFLVEGCGK